jgi:hypothetical protein
MISKHTLKLKPKTDLSFDIYFDNQSLKEIAHNMIGQPIYDGKGTKVENIIGKICSAWVSDEKGDIIYEADLSKESEVLQKVKKGYRPENSLGLKLKQEEPPKRCSRHGYPLVEVEKGVWICPSYME